MNSEYNKIDDIFRKALEGAVEQPSSGLWRKISGRLFWKEITQFNFTNFPAAWTGMAAAVVVITTLIFYNIPSTSDKSINSQTIIGQNSTSEAFDQQFIPGKETTTQQAKINDNQVENESLQNNSDQTLNPENFNKSAGSEIITQELSQPKDNTNAKEKSLEKSIQPSNKAGISTQVVGNPVILKEKQNTSSNSAKTVDEKNATTAAVAMQNQLTPGINKPEKVVSLIPAQDELVEINEIRNSGSSLLLADEEEAGENHRNSGKMIKMHSRSFAIAQLFQGKYKPPKREFSENKTAKYRGKNHVISLAAYFAPEMVQYTRMASTSKEQNYIGGISASYFRPNYVLQGGIELCFSNDMGDYMVNMETYDSTGYYQKIGSFTIDPQNPDSVIFNMVTVGVWDSVPHQSHQQTQNQYTYLQLPFMVGYKAMQRGLFSAYIKAGPSFSFLLNRKEPDLIYYNPNATIQYIENYTPTRLNASVQILISLCLQYQATENFGILVEPTYRYYLKSVYDSQGSSLKNPYGIGVRGGLYYNF